MNTKEILDHVLEETAVVDAPSGTVLSAARESVTDAAHARALQAAKVVRLRRRHRRLMIGVAAAAVAGIVAIPLISGGSSGTPQIGATPDAQTQPVQQHFTTVAQVIDAAAAASGSANPADAPYWKVVSSWDCSGVKDAKGVPRPPGSRCEDTQWNGNGQPGVMPADTSGYQQIEAATVTVDGRTMGWKQANAHTWTDAQVASMVADTGPSDNGRAPAGDYVFKNAIGLLVYMPASPTIRKQLWHELGTVQGAVLNGEVKDALGRTGWKVTLNTPGWGSQWLVVDPDTGAVLENGGNGVTPGTPGWISTIVSAGPADTAPAAPSMAELQQQRLAKVKACGVPAEYADPQFHVQVAPVEHPSLSPRQAACLASGSGGPLTSLGN